MDTYKVKWTRLQTEVFRLFCVRTGQLLNMRQIASALKVTPTAVSNAVSELEKEGLLHIKRSKTMNLALVQFNRDNQKAIELKRVENLRMLYESGLPDVLFNAFPGCTIFLFGSYSRGEDAWIGESEETRSDIDIAVIGTKGKELDLSDFDKRFEKEIRINFYKSWKDIHKHLKNNILNGIRLSGSVDL